MMTKRELEFHVIRLNRERDVLSQQRDALSRTLYKIDVELSDYAVALTGPMPGILPMIRALGRQVK